MAKLEKSGIGYIRMMAGTVLGHVVTYYLFACRFDLAAAWVYFGAFLLLHALNIILLYKCNPALLNERGKARPDMAREERVIIPLMLAFTYFIPSVAAGLEINITGVSFATPATILAGLLLLLASGALENWAMLVNRHFEKNIRLQADREHTVVTGGPYRFVRHPGYLGYILRLVAFPLMLGSWWGIAPVVVGIGVYVARTRVEDGVLMKGLYGYSEYAGRTRYRLMPLVW